MQASIENVRFASLPSSGPLYLLNRLNAHLNQAGLIPESQCGFRKDRGTIDMIFTARQLQEKCQEQNVDLQGVNKV